MKVARFYMVSCMGGPDSTEYCLFPEWTYDEGCQSLECQPLGALWSNWSSHAVTCSSVDLLEDVPSVIGEGFVVSDRFRSLLEHECPGACEFFPVSIRDKDGRTPEAQYWLLNALTVFDRSLADDSRTVIFWPRHGPYAVDGTNDATRAAHDARIGRWRLTLIIRADLARAFKRAGLTGMYISPAAGPP